MEATNLSSPLLLSHQRLKEASEEAEVIIDVNHLDASGRSPDQRFADHLVEDENPFEFLGVGSFSLPPPTTLDPFRNHTPNIEGLYEWLKILVCVPIAVVRLVVFGLSLAVGYVATKLALLGWKDKESPMPKWRSGMMWVTRICARVILFSFGYHWIKRKGKPASRKTAPIVVSNHVSFIEPIFFFYELFPTMVASESHDTIPFVGTIIRSMQVIYVNRFSAQSRKHAVNEIKRKVSCDGFPRVLLFPEGTTTNGRVLISFQLGAFIPGYPIQPVVVRYPYVHFDQSWGGISLAKLMFRMFTQFHNFMEVEYLPTISPLENKMENAVHFAERTSHAIASALNVVQTSHSYGDMMLHSKASQSKQGRASCYLVEMAQLSFHVSTLEAEEFLDKFLSMNPDPSGRVNIHNFLRILRLRASPLPEKIFCFIDVEKSGTVTFRQFLFGSAHVRKQPLFWRACALAFAKCDTRGYDYISKQQLWDSIKAAIPDFNEVEISELFKLFDADGDGRISNDDFMTCMRRNPLLIALFSPVLLREEFLEDNGMRLQEIM